jgi:GH15 family glucan-1,4-alpha-glucosidase
LVRSGWGLRERDGLPYRRLRPHRRPRNRRPGRARRRIDWLCWPRFDSATCFAALLGSRDNGRWLIGAADRKARIRRRYRDRTLILETTIETADGAATVVDFMPPRGPRPTSCGSSAASAAASRCEQS